EWLEDSLPGHQFVVRDYGLVLMPKDERPPPGAPLLHEFWKGSKAEDKNAGKEAKEWAPNPPPVLVEGQVKEVAKDGSVRLSVGSDAGLAKGHTLEVFRPVPAASSPMYITRIRIIEISAGESVGKPVLQGNGYVQ